jgi:hypothetical protein
MLLSSGCGVEPRWRLERRVVDVGGSPLPGVEVSVTALQDPHSLAIQLGGRGKAVQHIVTDARGRFTLNLQCRALFIELRKPGYVPKKFAFDGAISSPQALPPSASIELAKEQVMPGADDLDAKGDRDLTVEFTAGHGAVAVSLLDGAVVSSSSPDAPLSLRLLPGALRVECLHGASVLPVDWEPGITVESWKENHAVVPGKDFERGLTLNCPFPPRSLDPAGAFFLRDTTEDHKAYYARVYVFTITPNEYRLSFSLSRAPFFVTRIEQKAVGQNY